MTGRFAEDLIYLDNNATTAMDPLVMDAVNTANHELVGNPSSHHRMGMKSSNAIEDARETVANSFGCKAQNVLFTSGATESNNLGLIGLWEASRFSGQDARSHSGWCYGTSLDH